MNYQHLQTEINGPALIVTINRPKALNALCGDLVVELNYLFTTGYKDLGEFSSVIITGSGAKAFVAGADISEFTSLEPGQGKEFASRGQAAMAAIEQFHKPVIAAVNGYALGGGFELALACHIRYASTNARFGLPEVNLGLIPGFGGTQRLAHVAGKGTAFQLALTGAMINAEEAYRRGIVTEVVEQEELLAKCLKVAGVLSKKAPIALTKVISSVNGAYEPGGAQGYEVESDSFDSLMSTNDFKEGVDAFLNKREAQFKGE